MKFYLVFCNSHIKEKDGIEILKKKIRIITKCIIVEIFRIIAYWNTVFVYDAVLLFDAEPGLMSLLWLVARDRVTLKSL